MNEEFLKLLVCPKCYVDLEKVSETELRCRKCHTSYLIKDGIPILLVD